MSQDIASVKYEPFEQKTRNGELIEIMLTENSENKMRPWVISGLDAFVNGEHAGYFKGSFIPPEVNRYYGGIWWFFTRSWPYNNKKIIDYCIENNCSAYNLPMEIWRNILTDTIAILSSRGHRPAVLIEEISKANNKELRAIRLRLKKQLMDIPNIGSIYREKIRFHGKKSAFVEYSKVFGPEDYVHYGAGVRPAHKLDDHHNSYRGQGVGFALYQTAAHYYAEYHCVSLRASGIQTAYAKYLWKRMEELEHPNLTTVRIWMNSAQKYISYRALDYTNTIYTHGVSK